MQTAMPKKLTPRQPRSALSAEHKVAFALLMFLGIGGILFGFRSFGSSLSRPFDLQIAEYIKSDRFISSLQKETEEREAQKTRDTDSDELSDYDELYVYKTSPYLEDTDSDGYDDKTEVFAGQDPNCPAGNICSGIVASEGAGDTGASADSLLEGIPNNTITGDKLDIDFSSEQDVVDFFESLTLDQIRSALVESGMSQEELDTVDDETLRSLFDSGVDDVASTGAIQQLLEQNDSSDSSTSSVINNQEFETEEEAMEYLSSLSNNEIRQMLLDSGVSQEELDAIDDETLRSVIQNQ